MAQTSLIVHRPGDRGPVDDLAREKAERRRDTLRGERQPRQARAGRVGDGIGDGGGRRADGRLADAACAEGDRKSTRLNSSHSQISYAVFCLKKKKKRKKSAR